MRAAHAAELRRRPDDDGSGETNDFEAEAAAAEEAEQNKGDLMLARIELKNLREKVAAQAEVAQGGAATNLIDPADVVGPQVAARLAAATSRIVLVAWSLDHAPAAVERAPPALHFFASPLVSARGGQGVRLLSFGFSAFINDFQINLTTRPLGVHTNPT